jgi:antitoxin PrlF
MLDVLEALQKAEFVTNAEGQSVVQINLSDWAVIQAAIQPTLDDPEDSLMLQLFLDFITTEALTRDRLQPYTTQMSETAHRLIDGVPLEDE